MNGLPGRGAYTAAAMSKVEDAALRELRSAELRAERLSAAIRAVVFLALLAIFASIDVDHHHDTYAVLSLSAYGGVTAMALGLAWRRLFHPALGYALVTFDVILVATHLILLVRLLALPHAMAYGVPAAGLIYLVLAHAALRFRSALVLYAAALFVGMLKGSRLALPDSEHARLLAGADPAHLVTVN